MTDAVPKQIEATFTHHGMDATFRARAPREARVLAVAMAVGIVLPLIPVGALIAIGTWWPDHLADSFGFVMFGILATLFAQVTVGPLLFNWAGKPAEIHLHIDEAMLQWEREGERFAFELRHVTDIEALPGEIRVEDPLNTQRMPCSGLKPEAVTWLEARMKEAWTRRRAQMQESALDAAERRRIGQLVNRDS